jgi:hypothetical protein
MFPSVLCRLLPIPQHSGWIGRILQCSSNNLQRHYHLPLYNLLCLGLPDSYNLYHAQSGCNTSSMMAACFQTYHDGNPHLPEPFPLSTCISTSISPPNSEQSLIETISGIPSRMTRAPWSHQTTSLPWMMELQPCLHHLKCQPFAQCCPISLSLLALIPLPQGLLP